MGAALPHLKDIQAPIRMTIDEMDMESVGGSSSDEDLAYSASPTTSESSQDEVEVSTHRRV